MVLSPAGSSRAAGGCLVAAHIYGRGMVAGLLLRSALEMKKRMQPRSHQSPLPITGGEFESDIWCFAYVLRSFEQFWSVSEVLGCRAVFDERQTRAS